MKKLLQLVILFTFIPQVNINSQTPCDGTGFAGSYPCNNYDLMSIIDIATLSGSGTAEGSDIWGWTDPTTNKEYALVAMTNGTAFVDISDPVNPIFLGRLNTNTSNNAWRDVKVYNNHAFIVGDNVGAHGMQVFDLTRLRNVTSPPQIFTADTVYTGVNSCHNIVINESSSYAYLVGCNTFSGGPTFVDISDPKNPVAAGGYSAEGYTHDAQVITYNGPDAAHIGKEILIASNGNNGGSNDVMILDVTNKSNPQFISKISYPNAEYTHQGWFTEDHRYFILGDELDEQRTGTNTRTIIFDLLDLDIPVLSSTFTATHQAIDHNGYVKGNEYFLANYRAGMRVFDISNISNTSNPMTEVGYFDTYTVNNSAGFNGVWSIYPYFASGNIIISDIEQGLFIVRKSGTLSIPDQQVNSKKITIYPNPTDRAPIISSNTSIESIEVFTILGKKVYQKENINRTDFVLPINSYAKGIYLLKINGIIGKKLIIK
ncbi:choice-of-anchor B domain-containing protein [Tenacibaculum skagerrakense]|uniref:Choice-of-anchor B domain-containing protein n=1 Tax=Tenacibaculum skagerrakense TaxID=186571 RepID=A0A4R2NRG3_9FLAO|nr:choice-of-anchor B family protein [Tenacibaculum skagerrakense]TCP24071.1 choice-of-anchor B domain-containing protein [Tenacibaculum skagerrakense]